MDPLNYIQGIITGAVALAAVWGFIKVIKEIKKENDTEHDKRQRWDKAADVVEQKEKIWDDAVIISGKERQEIQAVFDSKLRRQDLKIDRLSEMMVKLLKAMNVILEDQVEKGSNGDVKKMHTELNDYVVEQFGK